MTTEFTEENYSILFDEQDKLVEIRYQGVNADLLATLAGRLDALEAELDAALAGTSGALGTVSLDLSSLTTLVNALSGSVNANNLDRIAGDEANTADILARHQAAMDAIQNETTTRAAALLAEADARGAAILSATGTIITDVANLATTVSGIASSLGSAQASIIQVQDALSTETGARTSQYNSILADFGNTNAAILSESTARSDGDGALALQIEALSATSGTNVFTQPDEPLSGMIAGDIWYDTNDGNKPYRYTGTAWVDVTDVRITDNAAAIVNEAIVRADGDSANATSITTLSSKVNLKTRTFAQNSAPVSDGSYTLVAGDLWIDLDSVPANKMYRWNGTTWVDADNADIAQNKADIIYEAGVAANATSAVAGDVATLSAVVTLKTRTFSQASAPVSDGSYTLVPGDLWIDTDSDPVNKLHRWNGSSWVETRDAGIEQARAEVVAERNARISDIGEVEARYSVKVNANGHVAGFGLIATNNTYGNAGDSEFVVDATRFKVFNGSSGVAPFLVEGGIVKMRNVQVENAQIQSLDMGKVSAGNIGVALTATTAGSIRFGKTFYGSATAGIYLGYSGGYVFDIGSSSAYMRWTGSSLSIYGATITLAGPSGYTRYISTNYGGYIDWFGTGTVNDANAKFYIKTTGAAFFGGELRSAYQVKAWARFYGTTTAYFTRQFNFATVSKISTGKYQFTFSTAMPNRLYTVFLTATRHNDVDNPLFGAPYDVQTTGFKVAFKRASGDLTDTMLGNVIVFGSDEVVTEPPPSYDYEYDPSPPSYGGQIP